jgi:tape measure domain-containing protein
MAAVTTELKIKVTKVGEAQLTKLSASLNQVAKRADAAKVDFKSLADELKKVQTTTGPRSVSDLRNYRNAWRDIADSVDVASKEFKEATAEAAKLDKQLQKTTSRRGGRLRAGAQVAGTVAGAGVFGGPEGALGALGGAVIGGPAGAVIGGAIGAQVGGIRQALGGTAEYAASLAKLRIALQGVTTSQAEYQQSLAFIQQTTKDFAIPQEVVTRQFTKLQASVQGAGGNVEDTKTAFNGIVAAVRATGGSLADVDAALTATAQVFSKGKVSAEELRQQIGERLPGAFTLFAESIGMTPQELDKALEKGQVSLQDFQRFAEAIFKRYGENAKAIADAPESAGDRLKVALEELSQSVGTLLQPIGQAFQTVFARITEVINSAIKALNRFLGLGQEGLEARIETLTRRIDQSLATAEAIAGTPMAAQARAEAARLFEERSDLMVQLRQLQTRGVEQPEAGTGLPGIILGGGGGGGGGRTRRGPTDISEALANAQIAALREVNELKKAELEFEARLLQIRESDIPDQKRRVQLQQALTRLADVRQKIQTEAFKENQKALIEQIKLQDKAGEEDAKRVLAALKAQDELQNKLTETQKITQQIGAQLGQTLMSAFDNLINKTQKWSDFLRNALMQLGKMLMTAGLNLAAGPMGSGGILSFLGFGTRANGGPVAGGRPYLIGEQGPELFMPRAGGAVTSNRELRQAMSQPAGSMNFTFETTNIGGTEYVSREQLEAAMATTRRQAANDGAKRGMNMTLDRMQNSPRTRARVGIA